MRATLTFAFKQLWGKCSCAPTWKVRAVWQLSVEGSTMSLNLDTEPIWMSLTWT